MEYWNLCSFSQRVESTMWVLRWLDLELFVSGDSVPFSGIWTYT